MHRYLNFFSESPPKIEATAATPTEVEFPLELWLKIYIYLHPAQLLQFARLSKNHYKFSQKGGFFNSIAWRALLMEYFPKANSTEHYNHQFLELYSKELDEIPANLRKIFFFMDIENLDALKHELNKLEFDPGQLLFIAGDPESDSNSYERFEAVLERERLISTLTESFNLKDFIKIADNSLLWRIRDTHNLDIYEIFLNAIKSWYINQSLFQHNGDLPSISDSAGNLLLHWQAALDTRLSLIDLPHEYEDILLRENHRGDTPARLAAAMNRAKFFDNVTWDEIKSNGATDIFETAILHGSSAIIEYCFASLSNSNDVNTEINSAFESAASTGQNDVIQRLWALYQAGRITFDLHWLDHGFIYAATFGHINTINLLLDIVPSDYVEDWNAHVDPTAHPLAHALNCKTLKFLLELHQQKKLFCRPGVLFHATNTFITHDRVDLLQILFKMITPSEATWILTHRLMCQETSPVVNCSSETLTCLINLGLKIDPNSELGNSLIRLAALNGNISMIKLLASIDFPVTDILCATAKSEGHDEAAEYLSQLLVAQNSHNARCARF